MSGTPAEPARPPRPPGPPERPSRRPQDNPPAAPARPPELAVRLFTLAHGVQAAFTGRRGGVSPPPYDSLNLSTGPGDSEDAVARNRRLVAAACGLAQDRMTWMRQVHGADVARIPDPGRPGSGPRAITEPAPARDACFTSVPGLALGVLSADCPAVLLADPETGVIGAAHSGRPGTALGVVPALLRAMTGAGADPARTHAVIGPAICGGCYEVPEQMRDAVAAAVPGSGCLTRAGTPGLDLRAGIAGQLAAAGVRRVRIDDRCTAEDRDLYSYRRDGRTGRFAGLIWLAP